ncbi:hypothetical protein BDV93DRAFT_508936 [Ceratobasidium sp. AG-I]|nr:hypothetical protein BDV93DRAFT_508936 [Ceratobasidium sp. AG-I]
MGSGTVIVITDMTVVKDLMDKRSQSTIDRPPSHIADRVSGGMNMALLRYTAHENLTQPACAQHISIQRAGSSQMLYDCLVDPKGFYTHIRRNSTSVILSVLFGKRATRFETKEVQDFFEVNNWGIAHDPDVHERPEDFWPARWITNEFGTKPGVDNSDRRNTIWFGTGRRLCPGIQLANNGLPIPVSIFNYSKPFMCTVTPRGKHHVEIINSEYAAADTASVPYEHGLREEDNAFIEARRREL